VIFRPGGVASYLVKTDWDDIKAIIESAEGLVHVEVDDSIVSPAVIPGSSGFIDCRGFVTLSSIQHAGPGAPRLLIEDGATLHDLRGVQALDVLCASRTVPSISLSPTRFMAVERGAIIELDASATIPAFEVAPGDFNAFLLSLGNFSTAAAPGVSLMNIGAGGTLVWVVTDLTNGAGTDIVSGPVGSTWLMLHDASSDFPSQAAFLGTGFAMQMDRAANISYNDHPPTLGASNVQDAIDALKNGGRFAYRLVTPAGGDYTAHAGELVTLGIGQQPLDHRNITLPDPNLGQVVNGDIVTVKSINTGPGVLTVLPGALGQTIDGNPSDVISCATVKGSRTYVNQGFNWNIVSTIEPTGAASTIYETVFVAKNGNDATGDGTEGKPYLTVAQAVSTIGDASAAKRYLVILGSGDYADPFTLKAWVGITGAENAVFISAPIETCTIDASWVGVAESSFSNLTFAHIQLWDFTAFGAHGKLGFTRVTLEEGIDCRTDGTVAGDTIAWDDVTARDGIGAGNSVKGFSFFETRNSTTEGGSIKAEAGPPGATEDTFWTAQNCSFGRQGTGSTDVKVLWAAPSPGGITVYLFLINSTVVGNLIADGPNTFVKSHTASPNQTIALLNGAGAYKGSILGAHVTTSGDTPSVTVGAAAGIGAVGSVEGNDNAGKITYTTAAGVGVGDQIRVNFASPYVPGKTPAIVFSRLDANLGEFYLGTVDDTGFWITASVMPALATTYAFMFHALAY
jgi:hypothetical protein